MVVIPLTTKGEIMNKKVNKIEADDIELDTALEEIAKKLKPLAMGSCGQTAVPSNAYHTKGQTCGCPCCSASSTQCGTRGAPCGAMV
jgi:hypothetical protein